MVPRLSLFCYYFLMPRKLLIATSNPGKVNEYREHLRDLDVELVSLKDVGLGSIDETGKTFEENALLKARTYFEQSGLPCIADDGGLEIDALNGAPGVYSRRWKTGDESATDDELIDFTLEQMRGIENRAARMRLVMAFIDADGNEHLAEAAIEGVIAHKASKNKRKGLPFRAVLFIPRFGKMWDDLTPEEDAQVNQRVAAIEKLKGVMNSVLY